LNRRSLRKEKDWFRLQDSKFENWDKFTIEWKARKLRYPWSQLDLNNERNRTIAAIDEWEKRNETRQFAIGLIVFVLGITVAFLAYLYP